MNENEADKVQARQLANTYPERLNIIYECPHNGVKKIKHHFNYGRPYDVYRVCWRCHWQIHFSTIELDGLEEQLRIKKVI